MHLSVFTSGIVSGALYALTALSLVIVYRSSKVVNFALGGMGGLSAYVVFSMLGSHLPYWLGYLAAMVIGGIVGGLTDLLIVRPLTGFSPLTIGISTFGLLLMLQGIIVWKWGTLIKALPVAFGDATVFKVGGTAVTRNQVFVVVVSVALIGGLSLLVSRTRVGLGMRATSSGPLTSSILGINVRRISLISWVLGGAVGAVAALMATPATDLDPTSFTQFNFLAFVAVVLGGLTSFRGVVLGGLLYGVGSDLFSTYGSGQLTATFTLVAAALILVLRPYGIFGKKENTVAEPTLTPRRQIVSMAQPARRTPGEARLGLTGLAGSIETPVKRGRPGWLGRRAVGPIVLAVVLLLAPFVAPSGIQSLLPAVLATYLAVLGLNVLAGFSGQLCLGTGGFAAVGAYTAVVLHHSAHVPIPLAIAAALVGGVVVGFLVSIPASRLGGHYLVLLTLLFALAVPELVLRFGGLTGGTDGLAFPAPSWLQSATSQYWTFLAVAVVLTGATVLALRSRIGKRWEMVRDTEIGARSIGLNPMWVKIGAFCWGSCLAAISGALSALSVQFVSPDVYDVWLSIYIVLAVIVGGLGSITGSLLGAALITLVPFYTGSSGVPPNFIYGVVLIVAFIVAPRGLAGLLADLAALGRTVGERLLRREPAGRVDGAAPLAVATGTLTAEADAERTDAGLAAGQTVLPGAGNHEGSPPLITLEAVTVGYGSLQVLDSVSLAVQHGEAVALIGANGAGKSTLLRTVSGLLTPSSGAIRWEGRSLIGVRPHEIARLGLAHVPEGRATFPDLTVEENLRLGLFGLRRENHGPEGADPLEVAFEWFPHLKERRKQLAGTLSGGEQQMVAVGRALASRPRLLMLDEPSLGLAPVIVTQLFDGLRRASETGIALLVVEQNSRIALELASRAYVLSAGCLVTEGTSGDLLADDRIASAYLGVQ